MDEMIIKRCFLIMNYMKISTFEWICTKSNDFLYINPYVYTFEHNIILYYLNIRRTRVFIIKVYMDTFYVNILTTTMQSLDAL